jgi:GT2 family glycosyltransferase
MPRAEAQPSPIMILIYEGWDMAMEALALHCDDYPNIWIIDNHSPNDRGAELQARFPQVRLFRTPMNGGWAYAYNRGIAQAMAEGYAAAYLLNSDAAPAPGAVEAALAALGAKPRAAAVGSLVLSWNSEIIEYDGVFYLPGEGPPAQSASDELKQTNRVHGAGMAISFAAIAEVGPFREEYFLYHEETDWLIRVQNQGWTLWVEGKSKLRHIAGASMSGANVYYYLARNHLLAFKRGTFLGGPSETFWSVLWQEASRMYQADPERRLAVNQGVIDGLWGRTGPRPSKVNRRLVWLQTLPIRVAMKVRSLRKNT